MTPYTGDRPEWYVPATPPALCNALMEFSFDSARLVCDSPAVKAQWRGCVHEHAVWHVSCASHAELFAHLDVECGYCEDHTCLWHTLKTVTFSSP